MERKLHNILVTGGAGFIGSNFIRYLFNMPASCSFDDACFDGIVVNADCLTYAGNLENLYEVEEKFGGKRYFFERADICDSAAMERIFRQYDIDTVVHFAAESHVDRSIVSPDSFMKTNVMGTFTLLEAARRVWTMADGSVRGDVLFHHVSTDEVYGSLDDCGFFSEESVYDPHSPYSASKGAADHIVMSYFYTYGIPVTVSNCSNNYGPYQFPEKFIPHMILELMDGCSLPVYGDGSNVRDWIYVEDHNRALWLILHGGRAGCKYNIGGENQWENIRLLHRLIGAVAQESGASPQWVSLAESRIVFVKDRPGHDKRYAIDCGRIKRELGWNRLMSFEEGLELTVRWYINHSSWTGNILSGSYRDWIVENYANRGV